LQILTDFSEKCSFENFESSNLSNKKKRKRKKVKKRKFTGRKK